MKLSFERIWSEMKCSLEIHAWRRDTSHPDYRAGYDIRKCDNCKTVHIYASELGRWIENKR